MDKCLEVYLNDGPSDTHIKTVNSLLSSSKTTASGWNLLASILDYCHEDFFNENLTNWLDNCLSQNSQGNMTEIKLSIIEKFLEASINNHELSKKILTEYLSKIVDFCLSNKLKCHLIDKTLDILILCLKKYGNWFVSRKIQIEKYILSFLDNNSEFTVNKASICFLYLQQVGNAGSDGINHKNNYKIAVQKLCSTLYDLFDEFLVNRIEINKIERPEQDGFIIDELPNKTAFFIAKRIKNVISFIITMLEKKFTVFKQIIPGEIINIIIGGTSTQYCAHSVGKDEFNAEFFLLLNSIQIKLIHLLRTLILWLRNSSFPYTFIVSKILLDSLKKSQNCRCYSVIDCVLQETVYKCLNTWIMISKCGLNDRFQKELIECVMRDIIPVKESVVLKNSKIDVNKPNSGGKKTKIEIKNDEIKCLLALDTLITLFSSGFIRTKQTTLNDLFKAIWGVLNDINTKKNVYLYTNKKNLEKIHDLLASFYEQGVLKVSLPCTLQILNNSLCDRRINVAMASKRGLDSIERLCQPVSPFQTVINVNTVQHVTDNQNEVNTTFLQQSSIDMFVDDNEDMEKANDEIPRDIIREFDNEPETKRTKIDDIEMKKNVAITTDIIKTRQDSGVLEGETDIGSEKMTNSSLDIDMTEEITSFVDEVLED
ncbi:uncharacterized protein LOC130443170 [Diorhabda sublineata]|uniref:uncharacterized protein LOC130443170 n=1 Tax=Diorhabda sublineata TaxID=1163346 RepID=UPI0024E18C33|nr:uncharacterized protein LOC130443170 [Diorhabda sublineata]